MLRLKLEFPDQLREDGLLFHHGKLLADAVPRAGRKRNVSVRVSGSSLNRKIIIIINFVLETGTCFVKKRFIKLVCHFKLLKKSFSIG
jgi:hypothetical protein